MMRDNMRDELFGIIEREFYSFDVLQLAAVIEELLEGGISTSLNDHSTSLNDHSTHPLNDLCRPIFFEVDPELSFPPADVGYVRIDTGRVNNDGRTDGDAPAATVRLPVMNLLGSSSPLPAAFSDHITRGRRDADIYADFLSILQNRLHALWLDAQRKYSLWGVAEKIFASMTGLPANRAGLPEFALAGLWPLSNRTRSAQGLKELLYAAFGDIPIYMEENAGRYAAVSNARPLGGAARLGRNAAAGTRVYDRTSMFAVTLGPLDYQTYKAFMPGGSNSLLINEIVSVYLNEPVICEILITCKLSDFPRARLGGDRSAGGNELGRTAALGPGGNGVAAIKVRGR